MTIQWIKIPGPGEFRGEGKWVRRENAVIHDGPFTMVNISEEEWINFRKLNYLPTHEGDTHP